jgi:osmotically-inducible protein OsmY
MKDLKDQLSNRNKNEESKKKQESSDQQSAQMVRQAIKDDQGLSKVAKDIHVTVKDGTVTLNGEVATEQQSNLATNTAGAVAVDDKVKNRMDVTNNK